MMGISLSKHEGKQLNHEEGKDKLKLGYLEPLFGLNYYFTIGFIASGFNNPKYGRLR